MEMNKRPRRLRTGAGLRKMVRETRMDKSSLIYPMFIKEGAGIEEEIPTMPGQYRYSIDRMPYALEKLQKAGVGSVMLFGIPEHKDACGSGAFADDGIIQRAFREAKKQFPDLYCIGDVCMCEYTSHGHCGILNGEYVDNDKTLDYLAKIALSQVQAGADMVAPSDMMDGRVGTHPYHTGRKRICGNPHYVLRRKIRLRLLRSFPGCGGQRPGLRRPQILSDGLPQQP